MNAVNDALTAVFDVLLAPLEMLGREFALIVVSGLFGVLALLVFKHISHQKGIKRAKDRIKGHMIEIRIYQDDLGIVAGAVGRIVLQNLKYVGLNLLPFVPLAIPFVFVLAQLVTRYAYAPIAVREDGRVLAGQGALIEVDLASAQRAEAEGLTIRYPPFLRPLTEPVRAPSDGRAFQEVVATGAGRGEIELVLADGTRVTKAVAAGGDRPRMLQPERVQGLLASALWPAEHAFDAGSPFERVRVAYPPAELRWMPDGIAGVLGGFLVASIVFGLAAIKPLKVQI